MYMYLCKTGIITWSFDSSILSFISFTTDAIGRVTERRQTFKCMHRMGGERQATGTLTSGARSDCHI